ncbi:hypothetical protein LTS18_008906, partial [Coniosporium uncinatum]
SPPPAPVGEDKTRRSSSSAQRYANLTNAKRNPNDAEGVARRASIQEQVPQAGFLGKMWNDYTKGK